MSMQTDYLIEQFTPADRAVDRKPSSDFPDRCYIKIRDLHVARESYQRPIIDTHAKTIMKRFNWRDFLDVVVNVRENGDFFVIDGQHRVEAARRLFGDEIAVPCRIYYGLTLDEEAELYLAINHYSRKASSGDTFNARLIIGEKTASEFMSVATRHHYPVIANAPVRGMPAGTLVASACEYVIRAYSIDTLNELVVVLTAAWGRDWHCYHPLVRGLARLISHYHEHPQYSRDRLIAVLSTASEDEVLKRGKIESGRIESTHAAGVAWYVHNLYNNRLHEANRIPRYVQGVNSRTGANTVQRSQYDS